ncbi:MAG TPA: RES family NAD+ phosphorylase [Dongiaceae bacterium]|nr:RES family NAD+ phosphorylase [Dongiaceae bacterium]
MALPPEGNAASPPQQAFRIARRPYADLSGEGARLVGGRWNSPGRAALYLAESRALAILETLVHLDLDRNVMPPDYVILEVDLSTLAGAREWLEEGPAVAPSDTECRTVGDAFLAAKRALALRVPSIIVPHASNHVFNPAHPLSGRLRIKSIEPFVFDRRLL